MSNLNLDSMSSSNRIKRELNYGDEYRFFKPEEFSPPLKPTISPVDITYYMQRKRHIESVEERPVRPSTAPVKKLSRIPSTIPLTKPTCKPKHEPYVQGALLQRIHMNQRQYADLLSTPNKCKNMPKTEKKARPKKESKLCSPRIIQMACPSKRRVLITWQNNSHSLPVEAIHRLQNYLCTDQQVHIKEARHFFKQCDKKKRKKQKKTRLKKMKKKKEEKQWLTHVASTMSDQILMFFAQKPNIDMNYRQLIIADIILTLFNNMFATGQGFMRSSKNMLNKEVIEMIDKLSMWIDSVTNFVDIQDFEDEDEQPEEGDKFVTASTVTTDSEDDID